MHVRTRNFRANKISHRLRKCTTTDIFAQLFSKTVASKIVNNKKNKRYFFVEIFAGYYICNIFCEILFFSRKYVLNSIFCENLNFFANNLAKTHFALDDIFQKMKVLDIVTNSKWLLMFFLSHEICIEFRHISAGKIVL